MNLNEIYAPVKNDLEKVESSLKTISDVDIFLLSELLEYVLRDGGKRIRPALTLLCGKFHDYDLKKLVPMGVAVELLHSATLVHDDVVDNSPIRRGKPSIRNAWGEASALLLGDYLFAKSACIVTDTGVLRVVKLFAETLMTISGGELAQIGIIFDKKRAREHYYDWISAKTACLFATSTESGAILSGASENEIDALKEYGHSLGMAFQVIDDVLDFVGQEAELGKPVGSDLTEGAVTLPSILYAEYHPDDNLIKNVIDGRDISDITLVVKKIIDSPVIDECLQIASEFCYKACKAIEILPDNTYRKSLYDLANYVIQRRK